MMKYYAAIKRNEVLIHGTTWMDLENVMLSEHSQTLIAIHCLIPFLWNIQSRQICEGRKYIGDCLLLGREVNRAWLTANRHVVSVLGNKNNLTFDSDVDSKIHWILCLKGWILQYINLALKVYEQIQMTGDWLI